MTIKEKILLGVSVVSVGGAAVAGYFCVAYKQAVEFLVEERDESLKRPFIGFVCGKPEEKEEE